MLSIIYLPSSDYLDVFICMYIYVIYSDEWDSMPKIERDGSLGACRRHQFAQSGKGRRQSNLCQKEIVTLHVKIFSDLQYLAIATFPSNYIFSGHL